MSAYSLKGKRIWVAGHRGMVGSAIVRRLACEDCEVLTVRRAEIDLRNQAHTAAWVQATRPDAVFLAAARVGGILENATYPADFLYDNLMIEANIIEASVEHGHLVLPGGRQPIGGDASLPAAVAMIRPETIRVVEAGSAPLSGTIDSVSFIGDRQRMVVSGASGKALTVDASNTIEAAIGERVGLLIAPDAVRLLPPES